MRDDLLITDEEEFAELIAKCNKLNRKVMKEGLEWKTAKSVADQIGEVNVEVDPEVQQKLAKKISVMEQEIIKFYEGQLAIMGIT